MVKMTVRVCDDLEYLVEGKTWFDCHKQAAHLYKVDPKAKYPSFLIGELIKDCHHTNTVDGRSERFNNPEYAKQKQEYLASKGVIL